MTVPDPAPTPASAPAARFAERRRRSAPGATLAAWALVAFALAPARLQAQSPAPASADSTLTLGQAARLAAQRSAPVQIARLRTEQAQARVTQRRADLLPTLSTLASENQRTFNTATLGIDFPPSTNPVTGQVNPPLFNPAGQVEGPVHVLDVRGRVGANLLDLGAVARLRAARGLVGASEAETNAQAEAAAATAAAAYLRVQRAEAQLTNRDADSTLAAELLQIARQQLAAGTGVGLDVTRAEAQLAGVRAQRIAARNDRDRARLELLRALDLPLDSPVRLTDALATLPTGQALPSETAAVQQALDRRPDLVAATRQVEAARQAVSAVRAERAPTIAAFADQGLTGKTPQRLLSTYTWGLQVSLPIFDGFRREGRVEETLAQQSELDVRRRDLVAQAGVEVRGALLDLRSSAEQLDASRERLRLAEQEVSQARDRFRAGVAGNADVVTASISLTAARTGLVDALTLYQSARIALARAEGAVTQLP